MRERDTNGMIGKSINGEKGDKGGNTHKDLAIGTHHAPPLFIQRLRLLFVSLDKQLNFCFDLGSGSWVHSLVICYLVGISLSLS